MDWPMMINDIFDEQVTRLTGAAMLPKNFSADVRTTRLAQEMVGQLIDQLGKESATSQGLNKVITSAEKLRLNPAHIVYLLKDANGDNGRGEIIGLLKVGRKHLFLFDTKETVHEVETLCVLDFYIVKERQRLGYGRLLFDFMLHELEVTAGQMAIDGPSDKMELFLSRNYGISKLLRQSNNFAVAPSFFDRTDQEISNTGRDLAVEPTAAIGRFAATKPTSAIANVIHGAGYDDSTHRSPSPAVSAATVPEPYVEEVWSDEEHSEPEREPGAGERFERELGAGERYERELEQRLERGPLGSAPERPASLRVAPAPAAHVPAAGMPSAAATPAGAGGARDPQLTDKGYFDVKYFHNRLCSPSPSAETGASGQAAPAAPEQPGAGSDAGAPKPRKPTAVDAQGREYYGFTPFECLCTDDEDTDPEIDDETYERYYFDMDQPAWERREEMRAQFRYSPERDVPQRASPDARAHAPPAPSAPAAEPADSDVH